MRAAVLEKCFGASKTRNAREWVLGSNIPFRSLRCVCNLFSKITTPSWNHFFVFVFVMVVWLKCNKHCAVSACVFYCKKSTEEIHWYLCRFVFEIL